MKTAKCGLEEPRTEPKEIGNSLFAVGIHKNFGCFYNEYAPNTCEDCGRPITERDQREAPYADGRFLCTGCRAEYMDLHHSDPFFLTGGSAT